MIIKLKSGTQVEARYCERCVRLLRPKTFRCGHKEAPSIYKKRRFCSKRCFYIARRRPAHERFWKHVEKTKTCWLWRGVVGSDGYGHFHVRAGLHAKGAHQVSWWLKHKRWAKKDVLHKPFCNTRICVRPDHLYEGDDFDNCNDKRIAGTLYRPPRGVDSPRARFTLEQVEYIRSVLRLDGHGAGKRLAKLYGVGTSTISRIKTRRVYA